MGLYQGRALREGPPRPRPTRARRVRRALQVLGLLALLAGLAHVPWDAWRRKLAVISVVEVRGAEYLDPGRVSELAGIRTGGDLLGLDFDRARQELLRHARIADARVTRRGLTGVSIRIVERRPALLVRHGVPWELDSAGVLLKPFADGAVADVPLLTGPDFATYPEGALIRTTPVRRGLEWMRALSSRDLQLGGRVSEIDVSDARATTLLLMSGTRVLSPAWPPDLRTLSALRVVLADLDKRGTAAQEVDLRFENQVIVRPVEPAGAPAAMGARSG